MMKFGTGTMYIQLGEKSRYSTAKTVVTGDRLLQEQLGVLERVPAGKEAEDGRDTQSGICRPISSCLRLAIDATDRGAGRASLDLTSSPRSPLRTLIVGFFAVNGRCWCVMLSCCGVC
jgi:hypothetical protein